MKRTMFTPNYGLDVPENTSLAKVSEELEFVWSTEYMLLAITLGIYCVLGTAGNLPVLIVYFKKRDKKAANTFIRVLAIVDLLVSVIIMPYTLIYELHLVQSDIICRGVEFLRHFAIIASNMTLVAIAVERYCAVSHLAQRFSVQNVNQGMLVVLTVSIILAFPSLGIFAVVPASDVQDINCSFPHVSNETTFCHFTTSIVGETVAYIYQGVLMLSFFISLIMIMIFYTIVYLVLWKRAKERRARLAQLEKEMSDKSLSSNGLYETSIYVTAHQTKITNYKMPNFSDVNKIIIPDHGPVHKYLPPPPSTHKLESFNSNDTGFSSSSSVTTRSDRTVPSTSTGESILTEATRISATSMSTLMRSRHHNLHQRTAKMLFLCTVIYVISWMPFWFDIFGATSNIVLRYTFFVGNATNPIVYGIVNKHIRKAFVRIMCNTSGNDVTNNNDKHCIDTTSKECDKH